MDGHGFSVGGAALGATWLPFCKAGEGEALDGRGGGGRQGNSLRLGRPAGAIDPTPTPGGPPPKPSRTIFSKESSFHPLTARVRSSLYAFEYLILSYITRHYKPKLAQT